MASMPIGIFAAQLSAATASAGGEPPAAAPPPPAWMKLRGPKRILAEFKAMKKVVEDGKLPFVRRIDMGGAGQDDIGIWTLDLHNFDEATAGGKDLNSDLKQLSRLGQDHIRLELSFPIATYPDEPFFARIVSPRCRMYTGHVTAGGSICLEALTLSGTTGSWQSSFSIEGMLQLIVMNMIDTPVVLVQTTTGPGGVSGPLRVDFSDNPLTEYSNSEAKAAFTRTLSNHRTMGWPGSTPLPSAAGTATASSSTSRSTQILGTAPTVPPAAAPAPKRQKTTGSMDSSQVLKAPPATEKLGSAVLVNMPLPKGCAGHIPNPDTTSTNLNNRRVSDLPADEQSAELAIAASEVCTEDWEDIVQSLCVTNDLSYNDAVAALVLADGDRAEAEVQAVACQEEGGAAKVYLQMVDEVLEAEALEAEAAAQGDPKIRKEVETLLSELEKYDGVSRRQVVQVQKVNNVPLFMQFNMKKAQMVSRLKETKFVNERRLFHGTRHHSSIESIVNGGFDIERTSRAVFGYGVYFSESSAIASAYCGVTLKVQAAPPAPAAALPSAVPLTSAAVQSSNSSATGLGASSSSAQPGSSTAQGPSNTASTAAPPPSSNSTATITSSASAGANIPTTGAAGTSIPTTGAAGANIPTTVGATATAPSQASNVVSTLSGPAAPSLGSNAASSSQPVVLGQPRPVSRPKDMKKIVVTSVLLGQQTNGFRGNNIEPMYKLPAGKDSAFGIYAEGCHVGYPYNGKTTTKDGAWSNVFCHVIFDNLQMYPEYIITFDPEVPV